MDNELNLVTLAQHFSDEDKAREFLEALRWPDGPVCPKCGEINNAYRLEPKPTKEGEKGKHVRKGVWKCGGCREQFTVTVGTIFEDSHIPLSKWLLAYHLLCASKKGMSAHQLHRMLKVTYRSAWFMAHRIRYTMTQEPLSSKLQGIVEVDETYVGGKLRVGTYKPKDNYHRKRLAPTANKAAVVSVLQRGGRVQSTHVEQVTASNLKAMVNTMIDENAHVMTDSSTVLEKAFLGRRTHEETLKDGDLPSTDVEYLKLIGKITRDHPSMSRARSRKFAADPYVVALAKLQGYTVVADESNARPNRKIPGACRKCGVPCLTLSEFIERTRK